MMSFTLQTLNRTNVSSTLDYHCRQGGSRVLVPKSAVALGGATGCDFCDEDAGVIGNVRHVGASCNAKAQTHAATLQKHTKQNVKLFENYLEFESFQTNLFESNFFENVAMVAVDLKIETGIIITWS